MIDNFAPQPYPLEASTDGDRWSLVIGWQRRQDGVLTPMVARPPGIAALVDVAELQYRPVSSRPSPAPVAAPTVVASPRRERGA